MGAAPLSYWLSSKDRLAILNVLLLLTLTAVEPAFTKMSIQFLTDRYYRLAEKR